MKFCENCGAQLPDQAVFCDECGERIDPLSNEPQAEIKYVQKLTDQKSMREGKDGVKILIGLAVVGVVFGIVFCFQKRENKIVEPIKTEELAQNEADVNNSDETKESAVAQENSDTENPTDKDTSEQPDHLEMEANTPKESYTKTQADGGLMTDHLDPEADTGEIGTGGDDHICEWSSEYEISGEGWRDFVQDFDEKGTQLPKGKSLEQMVINELYARHGYIFQSEELQEYFQSKPWYEAKSTDMDEVMSDFNGIELANVRYLRQLQ